MRVAIAQPVLPHYRIPFFRAAHAALAARDVELRLVYGQELPGARPRTVPLDVPWAHRVENRYLRIWGADLVWQPCLSLVHDADLMILAQANRSLLNYVLLAQRLVAPKGRLAWWGHGRNFRTTEDHPSERLKRQLLRAGDWWFAYTEISARLMSTYGVPADKITVVENAIDTEELETASGKLSASEVAHTRAQLGIPDGAPIVLFCGGLKPVKNIEFLLHACELAHARVPSMHLVVVGDGPDERKVKAATASHRWIHAAGPVFGAERVRYFAVAEALLMPMGVGLAIIDSFVMRTPLITTNIATHGPEIHYLEHEVNGLVTATSLEAYASAVVRFLQDAAMRARLRAGCERAARRYTLDNMVERFASGVLHALATPGRGATSVSR